MNKASYQGPESLSSNTLQASSGLEPWASTWAEVTWEDWTLWDTWNSKDYNREKVILNSIGFVGSFVFKTKLKGEKNKKEKNLKLLDGPAI